jgi:MSHA biogenesis protein MshO
MVSYYPGKRVFLRKMKVSGFTLLELIVVIIILGVMSVGIAGFIKLTTQTYLNVTERDALLSNTRFVVERLNREIRNAVPNSLRVRNISAMHCLEFVAIEASTTYIDIPVAPETARATFTAIPFNDSNDNPYQCNSCGDQVIVYPLSPNEVYDNHNDLSGKVFNIGSFSSAALNEWAIPISNGAVVFNDDSPTERLFIANQQISYCMFGQRIYRYSNDIGGIQAFPPQTNAALMAEYLAPIDINNLPFILVPATLTRNAMVKVNLHFTRDNEDYVFNHDIHINNIP